MANYITGRTHYGLDSLYNQVHDSQLRLIASGLPSEWSCGESALFEPCVEYHENVLFMRHHSQQHLGLGNHTIEHVAYSLDSQASIDIADHVKSKHLYTKYVRHPNFADTLRNLDATMRLDHVLYAGTLAPHWGHFILEVLPRLSMLSVHWQYFPNASILFNLWGRLDPDDSLERLQRPPYADYFQALSLNPQNIAITSTPIVARRAHICSPATILSGSRNYFSLQALSIWKLLNKSMASRCSLSAVQNVKRVYFSRRSLAKPIQGRTLVNEQAVEEIFQSFGFYILSPENVKDEFLKQNMLSNAEVIAGCAGSGLLNAAFAPHCKLVIILTNQKIMKTNPSVHHQLQLAYHMGSKAHVFVEKSTNIHPKVNQWSIDGKALRNFIATSLQELPVD